MSDKIKPVVSKEKTFDKLEIRLGQIVDISRNHRHRSRLTV